MFRLMILLCLALFLFNVYVIHTYCALSKKCDVIFSEMSEIIYLLRENSTKTHDDDDIRNKLDIKDIIISSNNINPNPYSPSLSSLIEVSDGGDSDNESDDDEEEEDRSIDDYSSNIKNVHMTLDLDELELNKFENIHVLLLDNDTPTEHHENLENKPCTPVIVASVDEDISDLLVKPQSLSKKIENKENKIIDADIKKMNLTDLKKYVLDNKFNINTSKMKKTEILKAIEDYRINQEKEEELEEKEII